MRSWEEIELVVATSWQPNENDFLASLKIEPGGIGAQFFEWAFACLFSDSINAKREFKQYYSVEYGTLERYLEGRYGIVLSDDELEKENIFLCTWLSSALDKNYDDNQFENVMKCIHDLEARMKLEGENEGQS